MTHPNWLKREIITGEPLQIGHKTLTPLIRKSSVKFDIVSAQGGGVIGFEKLEPFAIEEKMGEETRQILITDVTGQAIRSMLIGALVVWGVLWVVRLFARGARGTRHAPKGA